MATTINNMFTPAVTTFATLLAAAGVLGGAYTIVDPLGGARGFGLLPSESAQPKLSPFETAYTRIHGIRNLGAGLGNFALLGYWATTNSPVAKAMVRRCLGLGLVCGTVVGLGDAMILRSYARELEASAKGDEDDDKVPKEARELAAGKSIGHAITAVVILAVGLGLFFG
jgi:hypothetical protein